MSFLKAVIRLSILPVLLMIISIPGSTSAWEEAPIEIDVEVSPLPALGETAELNVRVRLNTSEAERACEDERMITDLTVGELLANPDTKAILEKHIPDLTWLESLPGHRNLKDLAPLADQYMIPLIEADLNALPKANPTHSRAWVEFYYTNPWGSYTEAKRAVQVPLEEVLLSGALSWDSNTDKGAINLNGEIQLPRVGIWKIEAFYSCEGWWTTESSYTRIVVTEDTAEQMFYKSGSFAYLDNFSYGYLEPGREIVPTKRDPVVLELDISKAPSVEEEAILSCRISSLFDVPDFSYDIRFGSRTDKVWIPGEDLLITGDLEWKGDLKAGIPVEHSSFIKFPREGEWEIYIQGDYPTNDRLPFSDNLEITITDEESYFGWADRRSIPDSDNDQSPFYAIGIGLGVLLIIIASGIIMLRRRKGAV